jgi:hypothetical protein
MTNSDKHYDEVLLIATLKSFIIQTRDMQMMLFTAQYQNEY